MIKKSFYCQKIHEKLEVGKKFSIMDRLGLLLLTPTSETYSNDIVIKLIGIKEKYF